MIDEPFSRRSFLAMTAAAPGRRSCPGLSGSRPRGGRRRAPSDPLHARRQQQLPANAPMVERLGSGFFVRAGCCGPAKARR